LVALHLWLVLRLGINEWPMPGRLVDRTTYRQRYEAEVQRDGVPFFPVAAQKDIIGMAIVTVGVLVCAALFGPHGPRGIPDPTLINTAPLPDFYFLALYALFALLPPWTETAVILVGPVVAIVFLLALPFLAGTGEKSWRRRPIAVLTVLMMAIALGTLTQLAGDAPWSPHMNAWSGDPVPEHLLRNTTALERQGALVFQVKQCRNCHALGDVGGERGPGLDRVAVRLTQDQLIRQVIQGGGNMPAYGKNLSPAETTALVAFLGTLHPPNQPPAREAARDVARGAGADTRASATK